MTTFNTKLLEALAADIGQEIYLDIAKWHLYLRDAHLHTPLAERLYPLLEGGTINETQVDQQLQALMVTIGNGNRELPLSDFIPAQGRRRLVDMLEQYQDKL